MRPSKRVIAPDLAARSPARRFCALALVSAGCSTSVGLQKDGTYILDRSEETMDCQRLANSIWGRLQVLKSLPDKARAERAAAAPTALEAVGRMFGGASKVLPSLKEYDRERAHVRSLHRVLMDKGCPPARHRARAGGNGRSDCRVQVMRRPLGGMQSVPAPWCPRRDLNPHVLADTGF